METSVRRCEAIRLTKYFDCFAIDLQAIDPIECSDLFVIRMGNSSWAWKSKSAGHGNDPWAYEGCNRKQHSSCASKCERPSSKAAVRSIQKWCLEDRVQQPVQFTGKRCDKLMVSVKNLKLITFAFDYSRFRFVLTWQIKWFEFSKQTHSLFRFYFLFFLSNLLTSDERIVCCFSLWIVMVTKETISMLLERDGDRRKRFIFGSHSLITISLAGIEL